MLATPDSAPIPFGHLRRFWFPFAAFPPHACIDGPLRPIINVAWSPFLLGLCQSNAVPYGRSNVFPPEPPASAAHTPPCFFLPPWVPLLSASALKPQERGWLGPWWSEALVCFRILSLIVLPGVFFVLPPSVELAVSLVKLQAEAPGGLLPVVRESEVIHSR